MGFLVCRRNGRTPKIYRQSRGGLALKAAAGCIKTCQNVAVLVVDHQYVGLEHPCSAQVEVTWTAAFWRNIAATRAGWAAEVHAAGRGIRCSHDPAPGHPGVHLLRLVAERKTLARAARKRHGQEGAARN